MFDLKKRNSLILSCGREMEEFRRVAVRRKVKGTVVDLHTFHTVPSNPVHLQSPLRAGQDQGHSTTTEELLPPQANGTEEDKSPTRGLRDCAFCFSPAQNDLGSPSPVKQAVSSVLNEVSGVYISPARHAQGTPNLASSPVLGSPSPGKRGFQSCSPLREGEHSSAKLSPRNSFPGKLQTPTPVQGKMSGHSPAKNSRSWLQLHRIPSSKTRQEKKMGQSLSLPDLIVDLDESRIERSLLEPLQSSSCSGPAITIKAPTDLGHSTNKGHNSPGKTNGVVQGDEWPVLNGKGINDKMEEGMLPIRYGSKFSCQWNGSTTEDGRIHEESRGEQNEEKSGGGEPKDEENTEQKLYNIANELLQTERAYVARLHLLDQVFFLRLTQEAGRGSFPAEVIRNIFSNISSIYSFHSQFLLPDLETCISHWCESPGLGKVLLQHAPFLRMYSDYIRNFQQAMVLVRTWTARSSTFRNIIRGIESQEVCGNLTLQHHMLEPVQRLPRYEMLLRDYLKKLAEDSPDYELAHKSLQTISMAATHSNSAIHKAENLKKLLEIYGMVGDKEVVNPTNEFLREGRLLKLAARNTCAMERHLFMFNNFLLCCTPKFSLLGLRFTVRCRIGVDGMEVQLTTSKDHPYTFQVSGKERTLELQASSELDRNEWIKVIQEAIDVFQKKNETFKLAPKEMSVEEQAEELGQRAPHWIRDSEVTMCMKCQDPFSTFTRRHHCRACGCVVCWKCLDNKVALEYDGNKMNKVCKACYSVLTAQRGDGVEGKKRKMLELEAFPLSTDTAISGLHNIVTTPRPGNECGLSPGGNPQASTCTLLHRM